MTKPQKAGLLCVIGIIALVDGLEMKWFTDSNKALAEAQSVNSSVTQPRVVTPEEMRELRNSSQLIHTEFGEFEQTSTKSSFPASQVSHDLDTIYEVAFCFRGSMV